MIDKNELLNFLLKARTKTYAGSGGKVESKFNDSVQLEFSEGKWFYRDIYYIGNGIFFGMDMVHLNGKPAFGASYYGNFKNITEEEADKVLKKALIALWDRTRLWETVEWSEGGYYYICNGRGDIEELHGEEQIKKNNKVIFTFYYHGGLIGEG